MSALNKSFLNALGSYRLKVARVVGDVSSSTSYSPEEVAAEIAVMVQTGKLLGFGDLTNWRSSEIERILISEVESEK